MLFVSIKYFLYTKFFVMVSIFSKDTKSKNDIKTKNQFGLHQACQTLILCIFLYAIIQNVNLASENLVNYCEQHKELV